MCWSVNCSGSEAESWGSWAVLLGSQSSLEGWEGRQLGSLPISAVLSSSTVEYVNMSDATKSSEKASLLTDHREDQLHSTSSNMTVITLQMKSVNWRVNLFYWPQRLNQQRCCWLIWDSFFLIKRSFAKALVTGLLSQFGPGVVFNRAVFHTSSYDLSILGPFLGMEIICDKAGFERHISW